MARLSTLGWSTMYEAHPRYTASIFGSVAGPPVQPWELQLWYHQIFLFGPSAFLSSPTGTTRLQVCGPARSKKQLSVGQRMSAAGARTSSSGEVMSTEMPPAFRTRA